MPASPAERQSFLLETLSQIVQRESWQELDQLLHEVYLQDVAHLLRYFTPEQNVALLRHLGPERAGVMLGEAHPTTCSVIAAGLDNEFLSAMLSRMQTDDAADIVGRLPAAAVPGEVLQKGAVGAVADAHRGGGDAAPRMTSKDVQPLSPRWRRGVRLVWYAIARAA